MVNKLSVKQLWREVDCVCFDVDSTVCKNEAVDDLALLSGKGPQVKQLTKEAMGGAMSFREALSKRLNIIRPSMKFINQFNETHQKSLLTPQVDELIDMLHAKGVVVYLVSGGFRSVINPVADFLKVPRENVFANRILFDGNGDYAGFDENEPTSATGGKALVIGDLKKKHGYKKVVMIGDGQTDLESCPPADGFIGFGGNVQREKIVENAEWFVHSFQELIDGLI